MRPVHRSIGLVVLVALAAVGTWLAARAVAPVEPAPGVTLAAEPLPAPAPDGPVEALRAPRASEPEDTESAEPTPAREVVREVAAEAFAIPDDAHWIEGRVVYPADTPLDEELRVVARGSPFPGGEHRTHTVTPEPDGRFRVALAPKTRTGYLRLEAHYLYLPDTVKVRTRDLPDEVLLEPQVGARLLVRVTPPAGGAPEELDEVTVTASAFDGPGGGSTVRRVEEHVEGVFELAALLPSRQVQLAVNAPAACDQQRELAALAAGESRTVDVALLRGARLTGRVEGPDRAPLADVDLGADTTDVVGRDGLLGYVTATTGEDGTFDLRGVSPGTVVLRAEHADHRDATLELGELRDGEVRAGLVLPMELGGVLEGVVQWPDGRPVEGARVEVHQDDEPGLGSWSFGASASAPTEADGRFRFTGLTAMPCTLKARARPEPEPAADGEERSLLERRRARRGPYWRATLEDVEPPRRGIVLVLQRGGSVSGRVVDDLGAPVERFRVRVSEPGSGGFFGFGDASSTTVSDGFEAEDGRFELGGVPEGEWVAEASAAGHGNSQALPVSVPQAGELVLVLPREATLEGVVLDPGGAPAPHAEVAAEPQSDDFDFSMVDQSEQHADGEGRFTLSLPPGEYELGASGAGFARSETTTLELGPAESRRGIVLSLRPAGRILGVLDPSVGELVGREVLIDEVDGPGIENTQTDDRGRFEFGGLAPGRYRLVLQEVEREVIRRGGGGGTITVSSHNSTELATLTLELAEGEERQVVLGGVPAHAVAVSGRVTSGGAPVAGATVGWSPEDREGEFATTTDDDGRYEVAVDGPGLFTVSVGEGWGGAVRREAEVPEGASAFTFDVELPTSRVTGRLVGPDGAPVEGAFVTLQAGEEDSPRFTQSAADGGFAFEYLAPATYELVASGSPLAQWGQEVRFGHYRLPALEVGVEGVEDLELQLPPPAKLEGTVLAPDGSVAQECSVQLRDDQGRMIGPWSTYWTDATGHYTAHGLGPGTYRVTARDGPRASAEQEVRVAEGASVTLDLVLDR